MGSLNTDGTPILKANNTHSYRNLGHLIKERDATDDSLVSSVTTSGEIRTIGEDLIGVIHAPGGTAATSGLSLERRNADNSVEVEKHTVDGSTSGNLGWQAVRKISGEHVSISERESATTAPSAPQTVTERKVFYIDSDRGKSSGFADWTIFSSSGVAVGESAGTTDTDIAPAATFAGASGETPV